ncbi:alpha/beta hydrolase domain-containing protein [Fulvivirgaceae bacterium BMA10]|uniref:Alpha/beta hydrolase domain-containing protein n=1 Tax=Splendidivirga corallicola TaxID=3051826 RepID=A0ABT8KMM6_9BACT|nr:alpha/beta hydrolase domain-containing protein [Fulvivirgaceae bacterium BMA10]
MKPLNHLASLFLFVSICLSSTTYAEVYKVEIDSREDVLDGKVFGNYGAYELIKGRIYFRFDPANPFNQEIIDLHLAPRNAEGYVEAWSNMVILQPKDSRKSRGVALVEVSNRGGKFSPRYFNRATSSQLRVNEAGDFGDALLMRQGLTVIWIGWEFDVPTNEGVLRLRVPVAKSIDGHEITGLVRSDWTIDREVDHLGLAHRAQVPYPVADFNDPANVLTVRDGRDAPRTIIPRSQWRFAKREEGQGIEKSKRILPDSNHVYLEGGFKEGKIYEMVYRSKNPAVVGLGLAAIRDVISYAKYDDNCPFPVKKGLAAGVSQTGRFLRHFLYQNFNTDEVGRKAYDGLMIITAGAGRGSFNHRFAQPSRDAHRYSAFFYPTDIFPFTSRRQYDPETFQTDGLLSHLTSHEHAPKIFYINTGYEYWGRAASLIHTSVDGSEDIEPFENERIYHLASGQHFVERFPPRAENQLKGTNIYRGNHLDFSVNYRALLIKLVEWVSEEKDPPSSAYPRNDHGTLVNFDQNNFPKIPNLKYPEIIHTAYRADYGPRWEKGLVDNQPPRLSETYVSKVSKVDEFGNEIAGVRNVELRVPLATYAPWNLRAGFKGGSNELTDFRGTFIPFPKTDQEKKQTGDIRPSLESLYKSGKDYLSKIREAGTVLTKEGFLLEEDQSYLLERAENYWNWIFE